MRYFLSRVRVRLLEQSDIAQLVEQRALSLRILAVALKKLRRCREPGLLRLSRKTKTQAIFCSSF